MSKNVCQNSLSGKMVCYFVLDVNLTTGLLFIKQCKLPNSGTYLFAIMIFLFFPGKGSPVLERGALEVTQKSKYFEK